MEKRLKKGDHITLISKEDLLKVLEKRNFCGEDKWRKIISESIGGTSGIVDSIEDKWAFDYFYFRPDGKEDTYSIPYQAVDFNKEIVSRN